MALLTKENAVKTYARALINEARRLRPHGAKTTQIGADFMTMVERKTREFIEAQVKAQEKGKRLGDPLADLTAGQRAAMKPQKKRRKRT